MSSDDDLSGDEDLGGNADFDDVRNVDSDDSLDFTPRREHDCDEKSPLQLCLEALSDGPASDRERILLEYFPTTGDPENATLREMVSGLAASRDDENSDDDNQHVATGDVARKSHANDHAIHGIKTASEDGDNDGFESPYERNLGPGDPRHFGHFAILSVLGRGGMGIVYEAMDTNLARLVALKLILPMERESDETRKRFLNEARATAAVVHPSVVGVMEVNMIGSTPYYVMPLIDADDFSKFIHRNDRLPCHDEIRDRTRIVEQVARAVHHAHSVGILHRDLKPPNILIRRSDQLAMLTDFGLAKRISDVTPAGDAKSGLTKHGHVLGTKNYAAPEQLTINGKPDYRADVYGLGATLYEALTCDVPFGKGHPEDLTERVKNESLPLLRSINPAVSIDLETIVHKALEKDRADRFATAAEFADELNREMNDLPIRSRRVSKLRRVMGYLRRHRKRSVGVSAAALLTIVSLWIYATRPAYLALEIEPSGALVTLDEQPLPFDGTSVRSAGEPGEKTLRVEAEGHEPFEEQITLRRGQSQTLSRNIRLNRWQGRLEITSIPSDADVVVRDASGAVILSGKTPLRSADLPSGQLNVAVVKPLFKEMRRDVTVPKAGESLSVTPFRLESRFPREQGSPWVALHVMAMGVRFETPLVASDWTLQRIVDETKRIAGYEIAIDDAALAKVDLPADKKYTFRADSLGTLSARLEDAAGLTLGLSNPTAEFDASESVWKVITQQQSEVDRILALYSISSLNIATSTNHLVHLIRGGVAPKLWEHLGGPFSLSVLSNDQAISVDANLATHVLLAKFLADLSNLSRRDTDTTLAADSLWSEQFAINDVRVLESQVLAIHSQPQIIRPDSRRFVIALAFLDAERLLSGSDGGELQLWDLSTLSPKLRYQSCVRRVNCIVPIPALAETFAVGDGAGYVKLFTADVAEPSFSEHRHEGDVTGLALSRDGSKLFSCGSDGYIVRFAMPEMKYDAYTLFGDHVTGITAYDDKNMFAACVGRQEVCPFDVESMQQDKRLFIKESGMRMLVTRGNDDHRRLVTCGDRLWSWGGAAAYLKPLATGGFPLSTIQHIAGFQHHPYFATQHRDGRVMIRDSETLKIIAALRPGIEFGRSAIAISPDDSKLALSTYRIENSNFELIIKVYDLDWTAE